MPGRIVQIAEPTEIYRNPATRFVGGFVGSPPMNFLTVPVSGGQARVGSQAFSSPARGDTVVMGIRGEDLDITGGDDGFAFVVRVVEPMGSHVLLTGTVEGQQIRVVAPSDCRAGGGETLHLRPRPNRISWMDPTTGAALEMTQ